MNTPTRQGGDTDNSASFADLVIQLKENRRTQSTAALPTEAVNKVVFLFLTIQQCWRGGEIKKSELKVPKMFETFPF